MGYILLFSSAGCSSCAQLANILEKRQIAFHEVNLSLYPSQWKTLIERSDGCTTTPQLFFHTCHIGGLEDMEQCCNQNTLSSKIEWALQSADNGYWEDTINLVSKRHEELKSVPSHGITPEIELVYERMRDPETGLKLRTRMIGFRLVSNTFTGEELLEWIETEMQIPSHAAVVLVESLYSFQFFCVQQSKAQIEPLFNSKSIYKFYEDTVEAINVKTNWSGEVRPAGELAEEMRKILLDIECRYISVSGKAIDYESISKSSAFKSFQWCAMEMQKVSLENMSYVERLAFFTNIYNILTIHGTIIHGAPSDAVQRKSFFNNVAYIIDNHKFSLNDIEHGVLRCNKRPPGSLFKPFDSSDPRNKFVMEIFDARIHFALVCGAKSCPAIKIYSAENIEQALQLATELYLNEEVEICVEKRLITLPRLLDWYSVDFGANINEVLLFIAPFLNGSKRQDAFHLLSEQEDKRKKIRVSYSEYDWMPNFGISSETAEHNYVHTEYEFL